jgi:hypothetical protein
MSIREQFKALVREVFPETMGGTPDLFQPDCGWDAWEEKAKAILSQPEEPRGDRLWDRDALKLVLPLVRKIRDYDKKSDWVEPVVNMIRDWAIAALTSPARTEGLRELCEEIVKADDIGVGSMMERDFAAAFQKIARKAVAHLTAIAAHPPVWDEGKPCPDCGGDYDRGHNQGCPRGAAHLPQQGVKDA